MGEINKVRIEAPEEDLESWLWLLELMHNKGLITIIQKPTKFYANRGSDIIKRAYFEIKLNREPE